jgi:ATP phosphoribosyltransferase
MKQALPVFDVEHNSQPAPTTSTGLRMPLLKLGILESRAEVEQIALMLQAALRARHKVALKCNVPAECLDAVVALLPSLHAPTVSHLYDRQWLALETIVDAASVRDLVPKLSAAGAQGILEYKLTKMV